MDLSHLLYYSVAFCWALNIYFLVVFCLEWYEKEPEKMRSFLAMAAVAVPAAALAFLLPARGGYDNNHDFTYLGAKLFGTSFDLKTILLQKEVAPLFTDALTDLASGYSSLSAVLWKNRLLPVFSIFLFFTGLRRLGAGITAAGVSAAFLFLNFLSPLNASAFSTTTSNIFIWILFLLALFDAYASEGPGPWGVTWIISSLLLVISSRVEFLPVGLLLIGALVAAKAAKRNWFFLKPANLALIAAGALLAGAWTLHALNPSPARQVVGQLRPAKNFLYQLGEKNLAVIAGVATEVQGGHNTKNYQVPAAVTALCSALLLFAFAGAAAGCLADRRRSRGVLAALALLAVWISYFSAIFQPMDLYPLHFMRHQLYFFLPFAYLFALGIDGFARAAPAGWQSQFTRLCLLFCALYAGLNAKAAAGFNKELRTNDRELIFLMRARADWPAGALAVHPLPNPMNSRAGLIRKYFPSLQKCPGDGAQYLLKYVSPEPVIFKYHYTSPLEQAPLAAGPPASAWRSVSFEHNFYTALSGRQTETHEKVPLTLGFFRMEDAGRDKAYLETLKGACALEAGEYHKALAHFTGAASADPACLNCKYFLALFHAVNGKGAAAEAELGRIEKLSGGKLPQELRTLLETMAHGEAGRAERQAWEILDKHPELFLRTDLVGLIRNLGAHGRSARG